MKLKVSGDKEVLKALRRIIADVDKALPAIALKSVEPMVDSARAKAPVQTGKLRDSISADISERTSMSVTIEVGPSAEYADDVEFGGLHRAAKPFLRPAADETEAVVVEGVVRELNLLVEL